MNEFDGPSVGQENNFPFTIIGYWLRSPHNKKTDSQEKHKNKFSNTYAFYIHEIYSAKFIHLHKMVQATTLNTTSSWTYKILLEVEEVANYGMLSGKAQ